MRVVVRHSLAGTVLAPEYHEMFRSAWSEFIELQCMEQHAWVQMVLQHISEHERLKVLAYSGGELLGGLVLVRDDEEPHVGPCLSVWANYVFPKHRYGKVGAELFRKALRCARKLKAPVLAYTHRTGDWRYSTHYRRIT